MIGIDTNTVVTALAAIFAVIVTNSLARRREHEGDWRKIKFAQYQQYILALSAITKGRRSDESLRQFSDAFNSMSIIAPASVIIAIQKFQIATRDNELSQEEHDILLNKLINAMRADIAPWRFFRRYRLDFYLLEPPPSKIKDSL